MNSNIYPKYKSQGFKATVIMVESKTGGPPTALDCKNYRQEKGIQSDIRVLYDQNGVLSPYGGHVTSWVVNELGVIVFKGHSDSIGQLESALQAEL